MFINYIMKNNYIIHLYQLTDCGSIEHSVIMPHHWLKLSDIPSLYGLICKRSLSFASKFLVSEFDLELLLSVVFFTVA